MADALAKFKTSSMFLRDQARGGTGTGYACTGTHETWYGYGVRMCGYT